MANKSNNKQLKQLSFAEQLSLRIAPYLDQLVKESTNGGLQMFENYLDYLAVRMNNIMKAAAKENKEVVEDYIKTLKPERGLGEKPDMDFVGKSDKPVGKGAVDSEVSNTILKSVIKPTSDIKRPVESGKTSVLQIAAETSDVLEGFIKRYKKEAELANIEINRANKKADSADKKREEHQRAISAKLKRNSAKLDKIERDVNTPFWVKFIKFIGSGFLAGWFIETFGEVIKGFVDGMLEKLNLKDVLKRLDDFAKEKFPDAYNIAKNVKGLIKDWYDKIISFVRPVYNWINEHTVELLAAIKKVFSSAELLMRSEMSTEEKTDYWYERLKKEGADKTSVGNSVAYDKIARRVQSESGYLDGLDRDAFMKAQNKLYKEQKQAGTWSRVGHVNDYSILEEEGMVMRVSPEDYQKWQNNQNMGKPLDDVYGEYVDSKGNAHQVPVVEAPGGRYVVTNNVTKIVYANKDRELTH